MMMPSHGRLQLFLRLLEEIEITSQDDLCQIPWDKIAYHDYGLVCLLCDKEFSARSHLVGKTHQKCFWRWEIGKLASGAPQVTMATVAAAAAAARAPPARPPVPDADRAHPPPITLAHPCAGQASPPAPDAGKKTPPDAGNVCPPDACRASLPSPLIYGDRGRQTYDPEPCQPAPDAGQVCAPAPVAGQAHADAGKARHLNDCRDPVSVPQLLGGTGNHTYDSGQAQPTPVASKAPLSAPPGVCKSRPPTPEASGEVRLLDSGNVPPSGSPDPGEAIHPALLASRNVGPPGPDGKPVLHLLGTRASGQQHQQQSEPPRVCDSWIEGNHGQLDQERAAASSSSAQQSKQYKQTPCDVGWWDQGWHESTASSSQWWNQYDHGAWKAWKSTQAGSATSSSSSDFGSWTSSELAKCRWDQEWQAAPSSSWAQPWRTY